MEIGQLFNPKGLFVGSFIPDVISKSKLLTSTDKLIYGRLMRYAGDDGICYPKQTELAEECGVSESAVIKSIANLLQNDLIVVEKPTGIERIKHFRNKYYFAWHNMFDECKLRNSQKAMSVSSNFTCASKRVKVKESHIKEKDLKYKTEKSKNPDFSVNDNITSYSVNKPKTPFSVKNLKTSVKEEIIIPRATSKPKTLFNKLLNSVPEDETAERIVHEFLNYYPTRMGVDHRPLSDAAVSDVIQQIENNLHLLDNNFVERSDYVLDQFFNTHFRQRNCDYGLSLFGTCIEQLFNRARTNIN